MQNEGNHVDTILMLLSRRLGDPTIHYKGFMADIVQSKMDCYLQDLCLCKPYFQWRVVKCFFQVQGLVDLPLCT